MEISLISIQVTNACAMDKHLCVCDQVSTWGTTKQYHAWKHLPLTTMDICQIRGHWEWPFSIVSMPSRQRLLQEHHLNDKSQPSQTLVSGENESNSNYAVGEFRILISPNYFTQLLNCKTIWKATLKCVFHLISPHRAWAVCWIAGQLLFYLTG